MEEEGLTRVIIGCAMKVHSALGPGFLESVYQNALLYELGRAQLKAESSRPLTVRYDGMVVGEFVADVLVEDSVLLELKAVSGFVTAHEVQLVHYLTATGIEIGLLINFGASNLQFRRKTRTYRPPSC